MRATPFCPFAEDVGKVMAVMGDRYPLLFLGDSEEDAVVELLEVVIQTGGDNVVAELFAQDADEHMARKVCIEQQT